ncbi:hypothetical protein NMG60_11014584 [Bertholletia excelsa]
MDPPFTGSSDSVDGFYLDDIFPTYHQPENLVDTFKFNDDSVDLNFMDLPPLSPDPNAINVAPTSGVSSQVDSPDDSDQSDPFLKYIHSVFLEENMEEKPSMFYDPLALQATEKSLYDVIGHNYPASPNQPSLYFNSNTESPDDYRFSSSSEHSTNSNTVRSNSVESQWITDPVEQGASVQSYPFQCPSEPILQTNSTLSFGSMNTFSNGLNGPADSSLNNHLFSSIFTDSDSILQYKKGLEEASKFLPDKAQLFIDLESYAPPRSKESSPKVAAKVDNERAYRPNGLRGRKSHDREDGSLDEERSSKQLASYEEDEELSEMFDRVLLFTNSAGQSSCYKCDEVQSEETRISHQNVQLDGRGSGKTRIKKEGDEEEVVDLRTLLVSCAQSVATDDRRSANEQLKQIRQHSSPAGTASQRLANVFANGLEARLAGTGSQIYASLASRRISAAEKLKAYHLYHSACPFKKMAIFFATKMIADLALKYPKKKLHIIDFGILYGFQWPILVKYLPELLPDGAPELRITGIEYPQSGFRPAELIEETGRRLAKYCERFNVPFQYNALAVQKWESINIEDLHIGNDEVIVVNCLMRLKNLHDETVVDDSPRDAVLKLIRKINPNIFIQSEVSGSYTSPFFVTRFREALFHYSSLFDLMETNIDGEDQERVNFEQEFFGREIMNVVACEGLERVERPETYKQWQVRTARAGFKMLPLDRELLNKLRGKVKAGYHKNFAIDEDGQWMLQGWKGRILVGSSCWVPA